MKTSKYIIILTAVLLVGLFNTALARPKVSINISGGHKDSRNGRRVDYKRDSRKINHRRRNNKWDRYRWKYCNRPRINISRSVYRYDRNSGYCVALAPMVIEKQTVIVSTSSPQIVQQQFDESTLELNIKLQRKKIELLEQLQRSDKKRRMEAIRELAGFSFDDNVRIALESVLLTEPNAELRKEAAQSLGNTNNIKALAALEKARVEDYNKDVRKAADEAIKKLKGN